MLLKIISTLLILFIVSCSAEQNTKKHSDLKVTNPNGMSEMSLIMEEWYTSMQNISVALNSGKLAQNIPDVEAKNIYKARASKPNMHGKQFDSFVGPFFYNYSQISKAGSVGEQKSEFNLTVMACINCHQQFCHGPIVRIKKLKVKVE